MTAGKAMSMTADKTSSQLQQEGRGSGKRKERSAIQGLAKAALKHWGTNLIVKIKVDRQTYSLGWLGWKGERQK
jgi:hypothetical protein